MSETDRPLGAVEQLILRETPRAHTLALHLARNTEDAKELVQEASYRLLLNQQAYDASRSGASWFQTVLRNLFVDRCRTSEHKNGVPLNRPTGNDELGYDETIPSEELGMLERLEREEDMQAVRRIVSKLRKELKTVLTLCDMRGLSYDQAAAVLSIPSGTIRSRLHRARRTFRSRWAEENLIYG